MPAARPSGTDPALPGIPSANSTLWEGERIGLEGAREDYGFDQALPVTEFIPYMTRLLSDAPGGLKSLMLYMQQPDHAGGAGSPQAKNYELVSSLLLSLETKFSPAPQFFNVSPAIERLRVNKDPLERTLIEEACFIGGAAMRDVMKFGADRLRAGRPLYERHLATQMLHSAALNGGETLSYVPVVAANGRSCVIHNVRNDQPLKDTDMVLMDAGAFFGGYRSDITRTWPVGGRFVRGSPQLDVYQAVLEVQEKVIEVRGLSLSLALPPWRCASSFPVSLLRARARGRGRGLHRLLFCLHDMF